MAFCLTNLDTEIGHNLKVKFPYLLIPYYNVITEEGIGQVFSGLPDYPTTVIDKVMVDKGEGCP